MWQSLSSLALFRPTYAIHADMVVNRGRRNVFWQDWENCPSGYGIESIKMSFVTQTKSGSPGDDDKSGIYDMKMVCSDAAATKDVASFGYKHGQTTDGLNTPAQTVSDATLACAGAGEYLCGMSVLLEPNRVERPNGHLYDHIGIFDLKSTCCDQNGKPETSADSVTKLPNSPGYSWLDFDCPAGSMMSGLRAKGAASSEGSMDEQGVEAMQIRCSPKDKTSKTLTLGDALPSAEWKTLECDSGMSGITMTYVPTQGDKDDMGITSVAVTCKGWENGPQMLVDAFASDKPTDTGVRIIKDEVKCPHDMVICGIHNRFDMTGNAGAKGDKGGLVNLNVTCCSTSASDDLATQQILGGATSAFSDCYADSVQWHSRCDNGFVSKVSVKAQPYQAGQDNMGVTSLRFTCTETGDHGNNDHL